MTLAGARSDSGGRRENPQPPLYLQVAGTLREGIVSGEFPVGTRLPTEDKLCGRFAVSRYTVREALRLLREDGLVSSRRGAGTVVLPPAALTPDISQVMSINDLVAFASGTRFAIDSIRMVTIDGKLASRTGLARGDEWLEVLGYRHAEGAEAAVCWTEYYINRAYAAVGRILQRHTGPVFPLIEDMFGLNIIEVKQQISATLVPRWLAGRLEVMEKSAALEVQRTYKAADEVIVQVTINTHPGDRFQHSMTMQRIKG